MVKKIEKPCMWNEDRPHAKIKAQIFILEN